MSVVDRFPEGMFDLPGFGKCVVVKGVRYDYATHKATCPLCNGLGIPWGGWYHCDGECHGVAWIETGEFMVPIREGTR